METIFGGKQPLNCVAEENGASVQSVMPPTLEYGALLEEECHEMYDDIGDSVSMINVGADKRDTNSKISVDVESPLKATENLSVISNARQQARLHKLAAAKLAHVQRTNLAEHLNCVLDLNDACGQSKLNEPIDENQKMAEPTEIVEKTVDKSFANRATEQRIIPKILSPSESSSLRRRTDDDDNSKNQISSIKMNASFPPPPPPQNNLVSKRSSKSSKRIIADSAEKW